MPSEHQAEVAYDAARAILDNCHGDEHLIEHAMRLVESHGLECPLCDGTRQFTSLQDMDASWNCTCALVREID